MENMKVTAAGKSSVKAVTPLSFRAGNTTIVVKVHFSDTAKDTMEEKTKKLLRQEIRMQAPQ